ncbi:MAG: hypothetical protein ABI067_11185 [Leifsonia sp.]
MSDVNVSSDDVAARARALIESDVTARVDAVRAVADAASEYDTAQARFHDASAAHEATWKAALSAGWSEKDLRATGVRAPGQPARKSRVKRSTATPPAQSNEG